MTKLRKRVVSGILAAVTLFAAIRPEIPLFASPPKTTQTFTYSDENITIEAEIGKNTVFTGGEDVYITDITVSGSALHTDETASGSAVTAETKPRTVSISKDDVASGGALAVTEEKTYSIDDVELYVEILDEADERFADIELEEGQEIKYLDIGFKTQDGEIVKADLQNAKISYTINTPEEAESVDDVQVFKLTDTEQPTATITEDSDTVVEEITDIETEEKDNTVTFETDSLAPIAVVYTVDFYFGDYEYHLGGGESILLSRLFGLLGIEEDTADVAEITFTNPELVKIERSNFDYVLTSLQAFDTEEFLTIIMKNGKVYEIRVEDATVDVTLKIIKSGYGTVATSDYSISENTKYGTSSQISSKNVFNGTTITNGGNTYYRFNLSWSFTPNDGNRWVGCYLDKDGGAVNGSGNTWNTEVPAYTLHKDNNARKYALKESTALTAVFAGADEYFVLYKPSDGGTIDKEYSFSTDAIGAKATPNDSKYTFLGWYDENDNLVCDKQTFDLETLSRDMTVTAKYLEPITIKYEVKNFSGNSGTVSISNEKVAIGSEAQGAEAKPNSGANFLFWQDSDGNVVSYKKEFKPSGAQIKNTTYYACFSDATAYLMVSDTSIANIFQGNNTSGTIDRVSIHATNSYRYEVNDKTPTRVSTGSSNLDFVRWEKNGEVYSQTGKPDGQIYVGNGYDIAAGDVVMAIVKPKNTWIVNYDCTAGGTINNTKDYAGKANTSDESVTATVNTAAGYEFDGWYIGDATEPITNNKTITVADLTKWKSEGKISADFTTITAHFTKGYTVTYQSLIDGVTETLGTESIEETTANGYTAPTKTGYKFEGWYENGTLFEESATLTSSKIGTITQDRTFTAKYTLANKINVTYTSENDSKGTVSPTETALSKDGSVAAKSGSVPTAKSNYGFKGWYINGKAVPVKYNGETIIDVDNGFKITPTAALIAYMLGYDSVDDMAAKTGEDDVNVTIEAQFGELKTITYSLGENAYFGVPGDFPSSRPGNATARAPYQVNRTDKVADGAEEYVYNKVVKGIIADGVNDSNPNWYITYGDDRVTSDGFHTASGPFVPEYDLFQNGIYEYKVHGLPNRARYIFRVDNTPEAAVYEYKNNSLRGDITNIINGKKTYDAVVAKASKGYIVDYWDVDGTPLSKKDAKLLNKTSPSDLSAYDNVTSVNEITAHFKFAAPTINYVSNDTTLGTVKLANNQTADPVKEQVADFDYTVIGAKAEVKEAPEGYKNVFLGWRLLGSQETSSFDAEYKPDLDKVLQYATDYNTNSITYEAVFAQIEEEQHIMTIDYQVIYNKNDYNSYPIKLHINGDSNMTTELFNNKSEFVDKDGNTITAPTVTEYVVYTRDEKGNYIVEEAKGCLGEEVSYATGDPSVGTLLFTVACWKDADYNVQEQSFSSAQSVQEEVKFYKPTQDSLIDYLKKGQTHVRFYAEARRLQNAYIMPKETQYGYISSKDYSDASDTITYYLNRERLLNASNQSFGGFRDYTANLKSGLDSSKYTFDCWTYQGVKIPVGEDGQFTAATIAAMNSAITKAREIDSSVPGSDVYESGGKHVLNTYFLMGANYDNTSEYKIYYLNMLEAHYAPEEPYIVFNYKVAPDNGADVAVDENNAHSCAVTNDRRYYSYRETGTQEYDSNAYNDLKWAFVGWREEGSDEIISDNPHFVPEIPAEGTYPNKHEITYLAVFEPAEVIINYVTDGTTGSKVSLSSEDYNLVNAYASGSTASIDDEHWAFVKWTYTDADGVEKEVTTANLKPSRALVRSTKYVMVDGKKSFTYTAHFEHINSLKIAKEVKGNMGSKDKYFEFTVTLTKLKPNAEYTVTLSAPDDEINGETNPKVLTANEKGEVTETFYLKHNQHFIVNGLPDGAGYEVTEKSDDYKPSVNVIGGTRVGNESNKVVISTNNSEDVEMLFTNSRNSVLPTGTSVINILLIFSTLLGIAGIIVLQLKRKKMQYV